MHDRRVGFWQALEAFRRIAGNEMEWGMRSFETFGIAAPGAE